MNSFELRKYFLLFFERNGHKIIPSSSLIPEDNSVLLTTAGMQQFKKYYTQERDPVSDLGTRNVASCQKSFRTSDIDEVGDESHLTFFEMLGNFSFGGYFKEEAIEYAYKFFKELKLKIDYVTVFGGEKDVPSDIDSEKIWRKLGIKDVRKRGKEDNFWGPTGVEGPCGPTTEVYLNNLEIWNIVFNEYYCDANKLLRRLEQKGIDTGMGFERLTMIIQKKENIFETDLFNFLIESVPTKNKKAQRIIADHIKASVFLISDGIIPSNIERGYILRRLLRRGIRYGKLLSLPKGFLIPLAEKVIDFYKDVYPELNFSKDNVLNTIRNEEEKFLKTLDNGLKHFEKIANKNISGKEAFRLYDTYGFPLELTKELAQEKGLIVDNKGFEEAFKKHKEISRAGAISKFGGHGINLQSGDLKIINDSDIEKIKRLHTATHLLHAALRKILGPQVKQSGSDITPERTRFDFTFPRKLTLEEIKKIEGLVNEKIKEDLKVSFQELPLEEAKKTGALWFFKEKYPPIVKIYSIGDFSKEFCGGPHVKSTKEIGHFKIKKEESSSAEVRRIRAIVE